MSAMNEIIYFLDESRQPPIRLSSHNVSSQKATLTKAIRSYGSKLVQSERSFTVLEQETNLG